MVNSRDDHSDGSCDTKDCTLRDAIVAANDNNNSIITFGTSAFAGPRTLALRLGTLPAIKTDLTIIGSPSGLTIDGQKTGGIFSISSGQVRLESLTLTKGRASSAGAIDNHGTLLLISCTLAHNEAEESGALKNSGTVTAMNCTFFGNSSALGGGAINNQNTLSLTNCTLSQNSGKTPPGGGIVNSGKLTIGNTILHESAGGNLVNVQGGTVISNGHNLSSDNASTSLNHPSDKNNIDPRLDPLGLQNNGGSIQTIALMADSPAINNGGNDLAPGIAIQRASNVRTILPFDGRGTGFRRVKGGIIDSGAYEVPSLDVNQRTVVEGPPDRDNPTTVMLDFTIELSEISVRPVTFTYQTVDSATLPATAGVDYLAVPPTTITFAPGEISKTINVTVYNDGRKEADEHVALRLSAPSNAVIGEVKDGIIIDKSYEPQMRLRERTLKEGNGKIVTATLIFTLSFENDEPVSQSVCSGMPVGDPAALPNIDYIPFDKVVSFAPGQITQTLDVTLIGDERDEPDEKFGILVGKRQSDSSHNRYEVITILDDDDPPVISADAPQVMEGSSPKTPEGFSLMNFTLHLSAPSNRKIYVTVRTLSATTNPTNESITPPIEGVLATEDLDFVPLPRTRIWFAPGETTKTVDVLIRDDKIAELKEKVILQLSYPGHATLDPTQSGIIVGVIKDNDG